MRPRTVCTTVNVACVNGELDARGAVFSARAGLLLPLTCILEKGTAQIADVLHLRRSGLGQRADVRRGEPAVSRRVGAAVRVLGGRQLLPGAVVRLHAGGIRRATALLPDVLRVHGPAAAAAVAEPTAVAAGAPVAAAYAVARAGRGFGPCVWRDGGCVNRAEDPCSF